MKADQFTIVSCSYNTPIFTECMLKSFVKYHEGNHKVIIIENSKPDDGTRAMLDKHNIPYVNGNKVLPPAPTDGHGWGWSHHKGLDWAIKHCTTPYCLIVDTDILFKCNLDYLFNFFIRNRDAVALGEHHETCLGGGDKVVLERLHPCFMMLDVNFFNDNNLTFNGSITAGLEGNESYDVGSYLYRRINDLGKQVIHNGDGNNLYLGDSDTEIYIKEGNDLYYHGVGLSWEEYKVKPMLDFYNQLVYNQIGDIDITDKFYTDINYET